MVTTHTDWNVHLEINGELTEAQLEDLLDGLRPHSGVVSGGPGFPFYAATLSISAPAAGTAIEKAIRVLARLTPRRPLRSRDVTRAEAAKQADVERDLERPTFPEIVGTTETAKILGVSKQRVWELARQERTPFPEPIVKLAAGPIWLRSSVLAFANRPRLTGRPRRTLKPGPRRRRRDSVPAASGRGLTL